MRRPAVLSAFQKQRQAGTCFKVPVARLVGSGGNIHVSLLRPEIQAHLRAVLNEVSSQGHAKNSDLTHALSLRLQTLRLRDQPLEFKPFKRTRWVFCLEIITERQQIYSWFSYCTW